MKVLGKMAERVNLMKLTLAFAESLSLVLIALLLGADAAAGDTPYGYPTEPWDEMLGNHRAIVRTDVRAEAVRVSLPWRRRDANPEAKAVIILEAGTGRRIRNVVAVKTDRDTGDVVFQPDVASRDYHLYYMPLAPPPEGSALRRKAEYLAQETTADEAWMRRHELREPDLLRGRWRKLPEARVVQFQARTPFDSFYPMEVVASQAEVDELARQHPDRAYLLFPEDREHPIKMFDYLPLRWIQSGPGRTLEGKAYRNEFYVFQIGVYARKGITRQGTPITVKFGDLEGPKRAVIPASSLKCFNLGGVDDTGRPFGKEWTVAPGHVGALWCGVQVPADAEPGRYEGHIVVRTEGHQDMPVSLALEVGTPRQGFLRDGGVDQPERLARLKWLDSTIGLDETITSPYTPLKVEGTRLASLGRQVRLARDGFPDSVQAGNNEVLAAPIALTVHTAGSLLEWTSSETRIVSTKPAKVAWESRSLAENLALNVQATMEFDGAMDFDVKLTASNSLDVSDIALEIPLREAMVPYVAGMGFDGGRRPREWQWTWNQQPQRWTDQGSNLEYFIWLGAIDAGLYCRLKSPLDDWRNGANGGVRFDEQQPNRVVFRAYAGARRLRGGEEMNFSFRLLPTPVKPPDTNRWKVRYAHTYRPLEEIKRTGATVVNIHHAQLPNLYINYPFLNLDLLMPYVEKAHRMGLKAKLYYTVRELTTRLPELWAFRSLGDEIYRAAGEKGHGRAYLDTWLQEHLVSNYTPAWVTRVPTGEVDAAIRTHFHSRLNNFYLEGLKWLLENVEIDGLYLDEVGYSRGMLQRVRRVLDQTRPGSMIDLHGNRNWWSCNSPIGYYMEHLPYVDRLWFGEAFDPNSPPDFWLIEMSGIPFGLSGDMLQNPNPWRGMIYGMTTRAFYQGADPAGVWKLWDDFGIEDAEMIGYWDQSCPVKTDEEDVLATVYKKDGSSLVSLASWADRPVRTRLKIDWQALGLDPRKVTLSAPSIKDFQEQASFGPKDTIPVEPGRGWLLVLMESPR